MLRRSSRRGFTLVEILLVSALMGLIVLSVARAFSNGLGLWQRADQMNRMSTIGYVFEEMAQDLRHGLNLDTLLLVGDAHHMIIPSIVIVPMDSQSSRAAEVVGEMPGSVEYQFDPQTKNLIRYKRNYGEAIRQEEIKGEVILSQVEDVILTYQYLGEKGIEVKSSLENGWPFAVNIEIKIKDGQDERLLSRSFPVFVGGAK